MAYPVERGNYKYNQTLTGVVDGSNTSFELQDTVLEGTVRIFLNGLLLEPGAGNDYTISGSDVTFTVAPEAGDIILASYIVDVWGSYASEVYGVDEDETIRKIRKYIGDFKEMDRLYITSDTSCSYIQDDGYTIDLGEKGWPASVTLTSGTVSEDKNSYYDPLVRGYRYLTFSGYLGDYDSIDIWYYTFKFADSEIFQAYGDCMIPPGLTADNVTQDHLILQTSIDLLENMTSEDMVDDGASIRDDQTLYDPSPGLRERDKTIKRLQKMLDALILQYKFSELEGVLID